MIRVDSWVNSLTGSLGKFWSECSAFTRGLTRVAVR